MSKSRCHSKGKAHKTRSATISFKHYVQRVLNVLHEDLEISNEAKTVMNNFLCDMFERLAREASSLIKSTNDRKVLESREIQGAVRLVFSGELRSHAMSEGRKAVIKFFSRHSS